MFWQFIIRAKPKDGGPEIPQLNTKLPSPETLPKSYYVGQEYIEDPARIAVYIKFKLRSLVTFSNINFDQDELHVRQLDNGEILCTIEKTISLRLFNDISGPMDHKNETRVARYLRTSSFVIGYIRAYIASINRRIRDQKYLEGHILARTISIGDIYDVAVLDRNEDTRGGVIIWPVPVSGFPPSTRVPEDQAVYIRDLIEAMTSYFQYNLDDSLRRVITSLENCFSHHDLKAPKRLKIFGVPIPFQKDKLTWLIHKYVQVSFFPIKERDLCILRENILFIYHIRNLLVHDKLRVDPSQTTICRKAIGTLLYLYQGHFISQEHRAYIFSFYTQFMTLGDQYSGESLELFEHLHNNDKKGRSTFIKNRDDLDKMMFDGLKIRRTEKQSIKSGEHHPEIPPRQSNHSYR